MIVTFLSRGARSLVARVAPLRAETGDTLIEVVISAFLVGLVVVGMLTGFGAIGRASSEEREHNQAIALADQSQEQLRSDPASTLEAIGTAGHSYTQILGGVSYTILQKAELLPESGSNAACNVTETKRQSGNAFGISSSVTWHQQTSEKRNEVVSSGVITPPVGSALEIDVDNAPVPTAGVSGVPAIVTYTPSTGGASVTLEQTTGSQGCVVFGGIPATEATIEIPEVTGYVTRSGSSKFPSQEVSVEEIKLAPNYTTHHAVLYNKAGWITAHFSYNGYTGKYKHEDNKEDGGSVEEEITGDTFVAFNSNMGSKTNFELGSTETTYSAHVYTAKPSTYKPTATSPTFLFPFPESEEKPWNVYAGDCPENNPEKISGNPTTPTRVYVGPGEGKEAAAPTSYTKLNLYYKKESEVAKELHSYNALETKKVYPVTITNAKCAGVILPSNESAVTDTHTQHTTIGESNGGHLEDPFQPFGEEFKLCLVNTYTTPNRTYTVTYANKALTNGPISIYLPQQLTAEVIKEREEKEAEYKAKETAYKTKEAEYKAKETAYKAKEAYKNKKAESEAKKAVYEAEKAKYTTEKTKYNTEKTKYTTEKTKYNTEKTKYETELAKYNTEKTKYNTELAKYNTEKTKSEPGGKEPYKRKYKEAEAAYKAAEAAYKNAETAYKNAETEYKNAETEYKAAEAAYKAAETAYKNAETAYKNAETEYKTDEQEAAEYETPLHEYETDHAEYLTDKAAYESAKAGYEAAKQEEEEATKDKVTVAAGTTCP